MAFSIITDSASNLSVDLAAQNDISVIPLPYFCDGVECSCLDFDNFDAAEYYDKMKNGMEVRTSQINPLQYTNYMEKSLKEGKDVLFVGMSSGISGSFTSARMAAEDLLERYPDRRIRMVDSLGASLGEGMLVLRAAKCRANGMDLDETADRLEKLRKCIYQVFIVDDLNHLRRTGRLSNIGTLLGMVLGIRPLLIGSSEGQIVAIAKIRGKKQAIRAMADKYKLLIKNPQLVGISHCNCPEDVEYLISLLQGEQAPKEILVVKHEPATGSHLGPGSMALYFEGDEDARLH